MNKIKNLLRPTRDRVIGLLNFMYDYLSYTKNSLSNNLSSQKQEYLIIKTYHALEKSLTFRERNLASGGGVALKLFNLLKDNKRKDGRRSEQENIAIKVLLDYMANSRSKDVLCIDMGELDFMEKKESRGGAHDYSIQELQQGRLDNPDKFFLTRYSIRDFSSRLVSLEVLKKSIALALKSPSSCNRQPWKVYYTYEREKIDNILKVQTGNKGFGHEVGCLLVIASDMTAYTTSRERNQHWIDGGIFSMGLVLALHSLGVGTCCLNWSKNFMDDRKIHRILNSPSSEKTIMMLAVGYPNEKIKVCQSTRKEVDDILIKV